MNAHLQIKLSRRLPPRASRFRPCVCSIVADAIPLPEGEGDRARSAWWRGSFSALNRSKGATIAQIGLTIASASLAENTPPPSSAWSPSPSGEGIVGVHGPARAKGVNPTLFRRNRLRSMSHRRGRRRRRIAAVNLVNFVGFLYDDFGLESRRTSQKFRDFSAPTPAAPAPPADTAPPTDNGPPPRHSRA
jgi:hypothetical protein